ncbi:MAG: hypothetical protein Q9203_000177 [Teloschistes exilis]
MSSTSSAAANHRQNFFLPPLLSPQSSVTGGSDGSSKGGRLPFDTIYSFVPAEIRHGLRTPPKDMSGMSVNPLLASNIRFDTASAVPSVKDPGYHNGASTAAHGQGANKIQPNPNARHHKSRSQENTSFAARAFQDSAAGGQNDVDESSIVSYLQIPSSINESKGSLAEFAAQITCFFWFETSFTLHYVEESKATPSPIQPLVSEAMPTMGFRKWVVSILSTTQVSQNVILLALMFIYRLKKLNPGVKGKLGSEFRLFTVALMLGNKFLDDNTYTNKTWAEVSGISVQEIHIMEVEFLSNMRYTLYASENEWRAWHVKLGKFWNALSQWASDPAISTSFDAYFAALLIQPFLLQQYPKSSAPVVDATLPALCWAFGARSITRTSLEDSAQETKFRPSSGGPRATGEEESSFCHFFGRFQWDLHAFNREWVYPKHIFYDAFHGTNDVCEWAKTPVAKPFNIYQQSEHELPRTGIRSTAFASWTFEVYKPSGRQPAAAKRGSALAASEHEIWSRCQSRILSCDGMVFAAIFIRNER